MRKPANTLLVIDDEPQSRRFISAGLQLHGYRVHESENGSAGLKAVAHFQPNLILLDLVLPDMNGLEVLETLRSWSDVPVIVLSIQADEERKVHLLRSGADDYMIKPFGIAELAARCEAALRRYHKTVDKDPVVRTGPLTVDLVSRTVTLDGRHISLTRQEYRLLHLLAAPLLRAVSADADTKAAREARGRPKPTWAADLGIWRRPSPGALCRSIARVGPVRWADCDTFVICSSERAGHRNP
jgi:two-component system, OmpR family, KDP operon response regulator KdpE